MDAIELLEYQHRTFEELFERLEADPRPGPLFERLADELAVHAQLEEQVLYPATGHLRTPDELQEAKVAHEEMKRMLAELLEMVEDDASFAPGLNLLRESVDQHIQDTEQQLLQATRAAFDEHQMPALAEQMEVLAREIGEEESPRTRFIATNRQLESAG